MTISQLTLNLVGNIEKRNKNNIANASTKINSGLLIRRGETQVKS